MGVDIYFWTDKNGNKKVAYGGAYDISPYDLSYGLNARNYNSLKANSHHGKLDSSRYRLHNQIIRDMFANKTPYKQGEQKIALFTGGGSASGKGNFSKDIDKYYSKNDDPVKIDSDELKNKLLQADIDNGVYSKGKVDPSFYHEESTILAKRLYEIAVQNNYPVLFDGTSTNVGAVDFRAAMAKSHGYKTEMCFMVAEPKTILQSSLDRYAKEGRVVPLGFMMNTHKSAQTTVPQLFGKVDEMRVYHRSDSNKISLIATGGQGKTTTITDDRMWNNFTDPNAYTLETGAVNNYTNKLAAIKASRKK